MSEHGKCEDCDYYGAVDEFGPKEEQWGQCRRYAPKASTVVDLDQGPVLDQLLAYWPIVHPDEWCGEFCKRFHFDKGSVDASEPK